MPRASRGLDAISPDVAGSLKALGERLRACRIARELSIAQMAERMLCSINTYRALEAGKPACSVGHLANALWLVGQLSSLDSVAPVPATLASGRRARATELKSATIRDDELDF
ncbi:MAG: helix-turn-helix domain-containing protein [Thauera sp.]|nr:helix-turn-helix domain-containing protein [Thauera sp.]